MPLDSAPDLETETDPMTRLYDSQEPWMMQDQNNFVPHDEMVLDGRNGKIMVPANNTPDLKTDPMSRFYSLRGHG